MMTGRSFWKFGYLGLFVIILSLSVCHVASQEDNVAPVDGEDTVHENPIETTDTSQEANNETPDTDNAPDETHQEDVPGDTEGTGELPVVDEDHEDGAEGGENPEEGGGEGSPEEEGGEHAEEDGEHAEEDGEHVEEDGEHVEEGEEHVDEGGEHVEEGEEHDSGTEEHEEDHEHGVHVVAWNFERVSIPIIVCAIIFVAAFLKVVFHEMEIIAAIVPESCLLIIFGVCVGSVIGIDMHPEDLSLHPDLFMLYLLPPIVLDASFDLNDRIVFNNIGAILIYAIVGTVMNCFIIGPSLYGLSLVGALGEIDISLMQCCLFASFIVAVDPVAVLAIFAEIGVNKTLYFLVFGESLLNDAVTIVLYNTMIALNNLPEITTADLLTGVASFFTVSLGALAIGTCFGLFSAIVTRFTGHVKVTESLSIFLLAYMAFIGAELFHWSGIISMMICGILQAQYSLQNISRKSYITVKYFSKMLSSVADTIIFMFLGLELVRTAHNWHVGFIMWSLTLCLVVRLFSTFTLTLFLNALSNDVEKIGFDEQFIMWYGGLRGAVSFALCATIDSSFPFKDLFLTATFIIILVTVFIQGITIKPFVSLCGIQRQEEKHRTVIAQFNANVMDHVMAGMEVISGQMGDNRIYAFLMRINDQYLKKWLQKDPRTQDERIVDYYKKISLKDHQRHIFESTSQDVALNGTGGVMEDLDPMSLEDKKERDKSTKKRGVFSLRRKEGDDDDMDDRQVNAKLRWALAKSAINGMHYTHDPNLSHDNERDILSVLREKHARIQENGRMRSPSASRVGSRAPSRSNSLVSQSNYSPTQINELPEVRFEQTKPHRTMKDVANGVAGKPVTSSTPRANGVLKKDKPRAAPRHAPSNDSPGDGSEERHKFEPQSRNTLRGGPEDNQLSTRGHRAERAKLTKKNIEASDNNSSDPEQNARELHRNGQREDSPPERGYHGYDNRAFIPNEHYQSMPPPPVARNMPQGAMRSHSFSPGSMQDEQRFHTPPRHSAFQPHPMMYRPDEDMYGPDPTSPAQPYHQPGPRHYPGELRSYMVDTAYPGDLHGYPGDPMYQPMYNPYGSNPYTHAPPPDYMGMNPYTSPYYPHPQSGPHPYGGPPPMEYGGPSRQSSFSGPHGTPQQLRHRNVPSMYAQDTHMNNALPLVDFAQSSAAQQDARRFATVIQVGSQEGSAPDPRAATTKL